MRIILLLTLILTFLSLAPRAQSFYCVDIFKSTNAKLADAKIKLDAEITNVDLVLDNLQIRPSSLIPLKHIGGGATAETYSVEYQGEKAALKVFRHKANQLPSDFNAKRSAIIIQKILGELGIAPKLIGVLDKTATENWVINNERYLPHLFDFKGEFAVLMEFVNPRYSFKEPRLRFSLTREQFNQAVEQIEFMDNALKSLGVKAKDVDATISIYNKVTLIDITDYLVAKPHPTEFKNEMIKMLREFTVIEQP